MTWSNLTVYSKTFKGKTFTFEVEMVICENTFVVAKFSRGYYPHNY